MTSLFIDSVAEWPEKIGTSWWAIGGAIGITLGVVALLRVIAYFSPDRSQHD